MRQTWTDANLVWVDAPEQIKQDMLDYLTATLEHVLDGYVMPLHVCWQVAKDNLDVPSVHRRPGPEQHKHNLKSIMRAARHKRMRQWERERKL